MKTKNLGLVAVATAFGFATGCATDTVVTSPGAGDNFSKSFSRTAQGGVQIGASQAPLKDLVSHPQPDLRNQYEIFVAAVNTLDTTAKEVTCENIVLKKQSAAYFSEWDREIAATADASLRSHLEAHRSDVVIRFTRISGQYNETVNDFLPYLSDLRNVQQVLANNLTGNGLSLVQETAAKATTDSVPAKASLALLVTEVDDGGDPLQR